MKRTALRDCVIAPRPGTKTVLGNVTNGLLVLLLDGGAEN